MLLLTVKPGDFAKEFARAKTGYVLDLSAYKFTQDFNIGIDRLLFEIDASGEYVLFGPQGEETPLQLEGLTYLCETGIVCVEDMRRYNELSFVGFDGKSLHLGNLEDDPNWGDDFFAAANGVYLFGSLGLCSLTPDEVLTPLNIRFDKFNSFGRDAYFKLDGEFFHLTLTPRKKIRSLGKHEFESCVLTQFGVYLSQKDGSVTRLSSSGKVSHYEPPVDGKFSEGSPFGAIFSLGMNKGWRLVRPNGDTHDIPFSQKQEMRNAYSCHLGMLIEYEFDYRLHVLKP